MLFLKFFIIYLWDVIKSIWHIVISLVVLFLPQWSGRALTPSPSTQAAVDCSEIVNHLKYRQLTIVGSENKHSTESQLLIPVDSEQEIAEFVEGNEEEDDEDGDEHGIQSQKIVEYNTYFDSLFNLSVPLLHEDESVITVSFDRFIDQLSSLHRFIVLEVFRL